jgi:hypothetical protein
VPMSKLCIPMMLAMKLALTTPLYGQNLGLSLSTSAGQRQIRWTDDRLNTSTHLEGLTYEFFLSQNVIFPWLFYGLGSSLSYLHSEDRQHMAQGTQSFLRVGSGFYPMRNLLGELALQYQALGALRVTEFPVDGEPRIQDLDIRGMKLVATLEWTGDMGIGILSGIQMETSNLVISESQDQMQLAMDRQIFFGGKMRW